MKLTDLDAEFVGKYGDKDFTEQGGVMDGAQGVMFTCPACRAHSVLVWFSNPRNAQLVPADAEPTGGRWAASGTGLPDLTLHPSINLDVPELRKHPELCKWHGWVKAGDAA